MSCECALEALDLLFDGLVVWGVSSVAQSFDQAAKLGIFFFLQGGMECLKRVEDEEGGVVVCPCVDECGEL